MRLAAKSGFMAAVLLVVMLLMAGTGYWSGLKLSNILAYITGPAWDTADGAMETEIGIQGEMAWMQSRLLGVPVAEEQLKKSISMTDEAFGRLVAANIMDKKTIDEVAGELSAYRAAYAQLRIRSEALQSIRQKLQSNAEPMLRLGEAMEDISSKQSISADGTTNSVSNGVKKNGSSEIHQILSGFYAQSYYLEQLINTGKGDALPTLITNALAAQEEAVNVLVGTGFFNEPIKGFGSEPAAKLYTRHFGLHKELMVQSVEAAQKFRQQFSICASTMAKLLDSLAEFEELGDSAVEAQTTNVAQTIQIARIATIFMLVLVTITVVGSYILLKMWVLAPINSLHSRITDLVRGQGDLTVRIEHLNNDELGDLGRGINQLMDLMRSLVVNINAKGREIVDKIEFNRSLAVATFNHTKSVSENAQNLAAASGQVFVAAGSIAGACVRASTSVVEARSSTGTCLQTTRNTAAGMAKVFDQVSELSDRITQLRNSAETIGNIVSVIGGISDQTNLLALNAAIEAARAGEQGRGFAVVADEVRTLASRTSQSTLEITGVINSIQGMSQSAFELINACTQEVSNKAQDSQSVCESLSLLAKVVDDLSSMVEQAASAAEEQAAVTKDMSMRVKVIADDSTEVDSQARASMASADGLNQLARDLNLELSRFRV